MKSLGSHRITIEADSHGTTANLLRLLSPTMVGGTKGLERTVPEERSIPPMRDDMVDDGSGDDVPFRKAVLAEGFLLKL